MGDVLTYHVDVARTGHNRDFPFAPVGGTWRRYAQLPLGAPVRAAPLFLSQFTFVAGPHTGETHDVVIIAAADNRVYAYSEDLLLAGAASAQLWAQVGLGPASPRLGSNIPPPVGICGTPVIDRPNGLIYVMAYVHVSSSDVYKLFALDLNTGTIVDQAQLTDAGAAGRPTFDSGAHDQRGGLNLVDGWVLATFADFLKFDAGAYHGWLVACNQANLSQQLFLSTTTSNTLGGGAWGPGGAAAAPDGTVFVSTGNGVNPSYDPGDRPKAGDFFEGVVHAKITGAPALQIVDHYQPTWARALNDADQDFGGSSPIVLPPIGGKNFVITTAKDGQIYLLGQTLPGFGGEIWTSHGNGGLFSDESKTAPAYFHDPAGSGDYVYVAGSGTPGLVAFKVDAANNKLVKAWDAGMEFGDGPGAPFIISESVSGRALVWVVDGVVHNDDKINTNPVLRAWDAVSGALVFHSDAVPGNDIGGSCPNFAPIVGGGKSVFVGTLSGVVCYANVPPTLSLVIIQSTFGQNEVDMGLPGTATFTTAGYVQLDGFRPSDIGPLNNPGVRPSFTIALAPGLAGPVATGITAMNMTATFTGPVLPLDPSLPDAPQAFLFPFKVTFDNDDGFAAMRAASMTTTVVTLTASLPVQGLSLSGAGQVQLTTGEDPRFVNVNPQDLTTFPTWLSFDLRFFKVAVPAGRTISQYGANITSADDAPNFITTALGNFTGANFDALAQDEETTKIEYQQHDNDGNLVFNFAVARVRLTGKNAGVAQKVRVFFRLFNAQSTASSFDAGTTYKTYSDGITFGHKIPLLGIEDGEYRTIPCFASKREILVDPTKSMTDQFDPANARDLHTAAGVETDYFFGCWLDVNQPLQRVLPISVPATNPDRGPWSGTPLHSLQEAILSAPHQCLIAEINFDETPVPPGANTGNSDKLAQRNIAWIDGPNPGISASRLMPHPVQVRPSSLKAGNPDELLILWGKTPKGSEAQLYLPSLSATEIVRLANRRYCDHPLSVIDPHTIGCATGVATLVPLPADARLAAGLLTIGLTTAVKKGDVYTVMVRQLSEARGVAPRPPPPPPRLAAHKRGALPHASHPTSIAAVRGGTAIEWRHTVGAFQFNMVISHKEELLYSEERLLALLRWMEMKMPKGKSWYPVLVRYIDQIAGRVKGFGGDPGVIQPSPTGTVPRPGRHHPGHRGGHDDDRRIGFSGKVAALVFDRFGDFEGFILDTEEGDRKFFSREVDLMRLVERAWRERLRITVFVDEDRMRRPLSVILHRPPAPI